LPIGRHFDTAAKTFHHTSRYFLVYRLVLGKEYPCSKEGVGFVTVTGLGHQLRVFPQIELLM
jgi:hypothetical protein